MAKRGTVRQRSFEKATGAMHGADEPKRRITMGRRRRRPLRRWVRLVILGGVCVAILFAVIGFARRGAVGARQAAALVYPDPPGIVLHSSMTPGTVHGE